MQSQNCISWFLSVIIYHSVMCVFKGKYLAPCYKRKHFPQFGVLNFAVFLVSHMQHKWKGNSTELGCTSVRKSRRRGVFVLQRFHNAQLWSKEGEGVEFRGKRSHKHVASQQIFCNNCSFCFSVKWVFGRWWIPLLRQGVLCSHM